MTQAFNLSQLANNLNTSGQLDATDGLFGALPVANGGTGQTALTNNAVLLGNNTGGLQTVSPGTSGNVLTSNGTTWQSVALPNNSIGVGQTWQNMTSFRNPGVTYTNTTGKPIMIMVRATGSNPYGINIYITVDSLTVYGDTDYDFRNTVTGTAIIPPGSTYTFDANWVYSNCFELR